MISSLGTHGPATASPCPPNTTSLCPVPPSHLDLSSTDTDALHKLLRCTKDDELCRASLIVQRNARSFFSVSFALPTACSACFCATSIAYFHSQIRNTPSAPSMRQEGNSWCIGNENLRNFVFLSFEGLVHTEGSLRYINDDELYAANHRAYCIPN